MKNNFWNETHPFAIKSFTPEEELMARLLKILRYKACDSGYSVPQLCRDIGMSSSQLHRKLIAHTGIPAIAVITALRLEKASQLLVANRHLLIADIAFECGFNDPDYFSRVFSRRFGIPPTKFRNKPSFSLSIWEINPAILHQ
ncbi:MAG TPA: helix-turn-helix transcriptional regulator [Saprospiraceae bacterium]|nr:helix-turn-helix transcriptional regulator [Saprospiraceae bacterium]